MCGWGERGTGEGVILGVMHMQRAHRFVRTAQVNDEGMMHACVRWGGHRRGCDAWAESK